uniref:Ceramide synthase 4a n=1 Tax=Oncorhynchus tshawytscha TaxID=74940 RepID=A0A8C8HW83_ONCTS
MEGLLDQWLWKEEYWLPPGFTWKDIEMEEGDRYPLPQDLLYTLPLALGFIALHYVFERVELPLSRCGTLTRKLTRNPPMPCNKPSNRKSINTGEVLGLGKQCGLSQRQMEPWFHHRRNQHRPSNTKKPFGFCNWRFVFYIIAFTIGMHPGSWSVTFTPPPWCLFCFSLSLQPVAEAHYWYYITELGFYWSLLFCLDVKRKDFKEQIIHHIATVFLIGFSYYANYVHVGTQVMVVHYSSDFLLEVGDQSQLTSLTQIIHTVYVNFRLRLYMFHNTLFVTLDFFHRLNDEESEKGTLNSKLALLANNCVLNNLTNHGNMNSRLPKAFSSPSTVYAGNISLIYNAFGKYSDPFPFSTFCYTLILKWNKYIKILINLHTTP